jgi:serine/threonine-protein kinase
MSQNASAAPPPFYEACPKLRPLPEVEYVILRVLAKNRDQRPATARELFEEFREAVEAIQPAVAPSPTPSDPDVDRNEPISDRDLQTTMEATASLSTVPVPATTEVATEPRPVVARRSRLPWAWILVAGVVVASVGAVGLVVTLRPRATGGDVAAAPSAKPLRFAEVWPDNFRAVGGSSEGNPWPDQVCQTPEDRYFNRFADGIYLPEGFKPEDPSRLVGGWPAVIVREGIRVLRIEGGKEWLMGAWDADVGSGRTDVPAHPVKLSGFYLQETEVTNGQFEDYLDRNQSARPIDWERVYEVLKKQAGGREEARSHPAVNLSRIQALAFARSLDAQLPTEAQWEFAARSRGDKRRFVWGDAPNPSRLKANIESWDSRTTAPVKSYRDDRTEQGVFDMLGNVQEFCRDAWGLYQKSALPEVNPWVQSSDPNASFVIRGANFNSLQDDCALTRRNDPVSAAEKLENLGFRLVVECPEPSQPR